MLRGFSRGLREALTPASRFYHFDRIGASRTVGGLAVSNRYPIRDGMPREPPTVEEASSDEGMTQSVVAESSFTGGSFVGTLGLLWGVAAFALTYGYNILVPVMEAYADPNYGKEDDDGDDDED